MLVTTNAPILEENSAVSGRRRKRGTRGSISDRFKQGYTRLSEAGALPVVENLLGLSQGGQNFDRNNFVPPPPPPPPEGMSTTSKIVIGVVILGALLGGIYYFKKVKANK